MINNKKTLFQIIISSVIFIIAIVFDLLDFSIVSFILYIIAYLCAGYNVILGALKSLVKGKVLDEFFLMSIASIGAFVLKENREAVIVMLFFQIGELFQEIASNRSYKAIMDTVNMKTSKCHMENGDEKEPEEVNVNDIIIVKSGEMIPLDGVVLNDGVINMASLTGEAIDVDIIKGDEVLSGSINCNIPLKVKVTKAYFDSTVTKIIDMVENATMKKAKSEKFITKFARIYTPCVIVMALILAFIPPLFLGFKDNFNEWLFRALSFLVVSCPCALVLSVPLSYFAGIGAEAKNKIIVKGSNTLEDLALVNTFIFDKTGTLTKAKFEIKEIFGDKDEVLKIAKGLEKYSTHPIASAINNYNYDSYEFEIEEAPGFGIYGFKDGKKYFCGSKKLLEKNNIEPFKVEELGTMLYVVKDNCCIGGIILEDIIKDEAFDSLSKLGKNNKIVVLSGDQEKAVSNVCIQLNISNFYSQLLPLDKVNKVEEIIKDNTNGKVVFVGDGINDAPVLALADVGISMGQIGSDAAIEASDVVILNDDLSKLNTMVQIAKKTKKIVFENIVFIIAAKLITLFICAIGILGRNSMYLAVFGDVGVCVLAVLNSIRALKYKK